MTRHNEDAPRIARIRIMASLMCADPAALPQEVQALEAAGIDGLHFDNPATIGPLVRAGARVLVGGSTGLFVPGVPRAAALRRLRAAAEGRDG